MWMKVILIYFIGSISVLAHECGHYTEETTVGEIQDCYSWIDPAEWTLTSSTLENLEHLVDGDLRTRWSSNAMQVPGQFIEVDTKQLLNIEGEILDTEGSSYNYPRGISIDLWINDEWIEIIATNSKDRKLQLLWPVRATEKLRIRQTGTSRYYWAIHELTLLESLTKPPVEPQPEPEPEPGVDYPVTLTMVGRTLAEFTEDLAYCEGVYDPATQCEDILLCMENREWTVAQNE